MGVAGRSVVKGCISNFEGTIYHKVGKVGSLSRSLRRVGTKSKSNREQWKPSSWRK